MVPARSGSAGAAGEGFIAHRCCEGRLWGFAGVSSGGVRTSNVGTVLQMQNQEMGVW